MTKLLGSQLSSQVMTWQGFLAKWLSLSQDLTPALSPSHRNTTQVCVQAMHHTIITTNYSWIILCSNNFLWHHSGTCTSSQSPSPLCNGVKLCSIYRTVMMNNAIQKSNPHSPNNAGYLLLSLGDGLELHFWPPLVFQMSENICRWLHHHLHSTQECGRSNPCQLLVEYDWWGLLTLLWPR